MELFGRRRDRWDGLIAAAALMLGVVSYQPWWAVHGTPHPSDVGALTTDYVWNAWSAWPWSSGVALGMMAAGIYLAFRGRPEGRAAALLSGLLLLVGVGLVGWQWHRSSEIKLKGLTTVFTIGQRSDETPDAYRRRHEEEVAAAIARTPTIPTRSIPQRGIYAGLGSLIVMLGAAGRGWMLSGPRPSEPT